MMNPLDVIKGSVDPNYAGLIASAPPSASPGMIVPDISYMKRYGSDYDILFMHSWPDTIVEALSNQWDVPSFPGLQVPLYAMWQQTNWNDYNIQFTIHDANPGFGKVGLPSAAINSSAGAVNPQGLLALLRVQLQIAWCKGIMLPNNDEFLKTANESVKSMLSLNTLSDSKAVLKELISKFKDVIAVSKSALERIQKEGLYSGSLQPPVIQTQYGSFLSLYGVANQCTITYKQPFTPLLGYPHRADVAIGFHRFFPPGVRIPTRTGSTEGAMGIEQITAPSTA